MAGAQPGTGGGKMLRAVDRPAGGGVPEPICPATAVPRWPSRAATPPRVISLPPFPSSSNASSSLQSSAPGDDGPPLNQPSSSLPPLSLQEWGQGGSPVEQEVVLDDDLCANDRLMFGPSPTREEVLRALSTIQRIVVPVTMQRVFDNGTSDGVGKDVVDDTSNTPSCVKISAPESLPPYADPGLLVSDVRMDRPKGVIDDDTSNTPSCVKISAPESLPPNADPGLPVSDVRMDRPKGVIDAFRSLHVNPSIKKMVVSISSDKAVWDAVMRNNAVKEVKRSFFAAESAKTKPGDTPDFVGTVVDWIMGCTKTMLLTLLDKIWMIVKEVLQMNHHSPDVGKKIQAFEEVVRSSFMISVVVFIVVVLFRLYHD